jgi:adenylosuccinate synthase
MSKIDIVIGIGFGDEGKGVTVSSLCVHPENTLVIRYGSGHQCGHSAVCGGVRHVFSNFGSGTLKGVPTYWTEYCTVNPVAVIKEGNALEEKGIIPIIIYNANAMVTTPFDIIQNLNSELNRNHGTVGVGFGTTIQRNEDHYHLYVRDLLYPKIRDEKLKNIMNYYHYTTPLNTITQKRYDDFINACDLFILKYDFVNNFNQIKAWDKDLIFEGNQGIMLDTQFGFFPNVTRSYTTSRNAIEFIDKNDIRDKIINTYYVTRAYQTRHGNGYMSNEDMDISYIKPNPDETNINGGQQGNFRKSVLDFDLLDYAIACDNYYNSNSNKTLVITCCDQVPEKIPITFGNKLFLLTTKEIGQSLNLPIITCNSDKGFVLD